MDTSLDIINLPQGIFKNVVLECLNLKEKVYYWSSEMKTKNRTLK